MPQGVANFSNRSHCNKLKDRDVTDRYEDAAKQQIIHIFEIILTKADFCSTICSEIHSAWSEILFVVVLLLFLNFFKLANFYAK